MSVSRWPDEADSSADASSSLLPLCTQKQTLSLCVAAVGRNADDADLVHAFGLGNRYHVRSIPVGIGVGVGFD